MSEDHTYLRGVWKPDVFIKSWNNKEVRVILENRNACQNILAPWRLSSDKYARKFLMEKKSHSLSNWKVFSYKSYQTTYLPEWAWDKAEWGRCLWIEGAGGGGLVQALEPEQSNEGLPGRTTQNTGVEPSQVLEGTPAQWQAAMECQSLSGLWMAFVLGVTLQDYCILSRVEGAHT